MRTFEEILAEANARKLFLANLFQLCPLGGTVSSPVAPTGQWQANFRHSTGWHDYGRGTSAVEALENALLRCKGGEPPAPKPIPRKAAPTMEDLL